MTRKTLVKGVIVYAAALVVAWFLSAATWGLVGGLWIGVQTATDPAFQQEVVAVLDSDGNARSASDLSPAGRQRLMSLVTRKLKEGPLVLILAFSSSLVAFSTSGFLCGWLTGRLVWVGVVPALSFVRFNPLVAFRLASTLSLGQAVAVGAFQFGVCYLFGYFGVLLYRRRARKRAAAAAQPVPPEPTPSG